ncbi:hypothetical protein [Pseudomonas citronellolis]|uniref:hypothetical protein n=1 Tax=Pseudomonas citronellolis TaxID=53408 RepID=UPI0023E421E4|nr:hypothetical protein [Pseudomonas citronellolis]MDF3932117.1 hypothetical protein [Pseudomonas citronellolis]
MQQLNIRPNLAKLLTQSAAARQAFAERRTIAVQLPAYQVKPAGKGFFHIIDTATGLVAGFRRGHQQALDRAEVLTIRKRDDMGAEG